MDVAPQLWTRQEQDLWARIAAHPFEDAAIALDFTRRLARTLSWPLDIARAGVEEYRRFCFLAVVTPGVPVTPSEEVDEIWHLHLTYTRDYWERWCGGALGRTLHHDPTAGGPAEQRRFRAQYAETLALYERYFGAPPADFWPGTAKRFAARPRYRLIDGDRAFVLPRPALRAVRAPILAGLLALVTSPATAETSNPLDWPGPSFLVLFVGLAVFAVLLTVLLRDGARTTGRPVDLNGLSPVATAYATGGMDRAADTLFLELAAQDAARHNDKQITISRATGRLSPELNQFQAALEGTHSRKQMIATFKSSAPAQAMRDALLRRNVILDPARASLLRVVTALPLVVLMCFGFLKVALGASRGRPVGILVTLLVVAAIGLVVTLLRERALTKEAREALAALRKRHDRAVRAPRSEDLALAFALGGAAVLVGTEHAAYAKFVQTSSGGGDGGSGCGGGGGGCGGCSG